MEIWVQMLWAIFAGVAGAIVPVAIEEHLTRRQRLVCAGVGILMAIFIAPLVCEVSMPKDDYAIRGGLAFIFGALGWRFAKIVLDTVDRHGHYLFDSIANRIIRKEENEK